MGRYVHRGSRGIALIDSSGEWPRLRYVFDMSDTGGMERARTPYLWECREEYADAIRTMPESRYGVDGKGGLPEQLERIASRLAEKYWRDYKRDILAIVADFFTGMICLGIAFLLSPYGLHLLAVKLVTWFIVMLTLLKEKIYG